MRRSQQSRTEARLLVADDEPNIHDLLASSLHFAGFEISIAGDGSGTLKTIEKTSPDLMVLDVMLPDMNGFTMARRLRERDVTTPTLFLTAHDDMTDKVQGLTIGDGDYVTKPFRLEEVIARIHVILRCTHAIENQDDGVACVAGLVLDEDAREVYRTEVEVDLSPTEFKLLRYLMLSTGCVMSKAQILDHVWEYDWDGDATIVESYISYLRREMGQIQSADGQPVTPLIQTRHGVDYILHKPKTE